MNENPLYQKLTTPKGFPIPRGSPEWFEEVAKAVEEANLLSQFPEGHVIADHELHLVIKQVEASDRLSNDGLSIISTLVGMLSKKTPDSVEMGSGSLTIPMDFRTQRVLADLMKEQDLSSGATVKQALGLYQIYLHRLKEGETVTWSGDEKRAREFAGSLFSKKYQRDEQEKKARELLKSLFPENYTDKWNVEVDEDSIRYCDGVGDKPQEYDNDKVTLENMTKYFAVMPRYIPDDQLQGAFARGFSETSKSIPEGRRVWEYLLGKFGSPLSSEASGKFYDQVIDIVIDELNKTSFKNLDGLIDRIASLKTGGDRRPYD